MLPRDVPDDATVRQPNPTRPLGDATTAVTEALRSPLAGPPLKDRVRPGQTVAIVISDITRPVPNRLLLPPILAELHDAGVEDGRITIVNGTGLHRINTDEELAEMLGEDIPHRYRIVQHVARDRSTLVEIGRSKGVPAELCRAYVEADVRVVTGFVEPHLFAGYSGGPKGVMPGVAGADIVMSNHGAPNLAHPKARWGVTRGNPVWDEIDNIVTMCPPHFLLNVTLDSQRNVTGVFAGDLTPAHEAAMAQARSQYLVPVPHPYDVVVVTNMGYPADTTFYQSVKGMSVAAEGVREGGAILLVAGCEEGIGSDDYIHGLKAADSPAALLERILHTETPRHDQWQIQCQAMVQAKAAVHVHSLMTPEQSRTAHVEHVEDPGATLAQLVAGARAEGRDGSVLVLPYGQLTVPVVG
jgi:nickel-dependent lactate racemase